MISKAQSNYVQNSLYCNELVSLYASVVLRNPDYSIIFVKTVNQYEY